jgi:hypothetical protein
MTLVLALAFTIGMPTQARAADLGCKVAVGVDLKTTRESGSRAVDVVVLPDCSTVVGLARPLTPAEVATFSTAGADSLQQRCTWANRLIGAGGEGDILTELTAYQTFSYDFTNVLTESSNGSTYVHSSTLWYVINSTIQSLSSTPTPTYTVEVTGSFGWSGSWNHDKLTDAYANGDGTCTGHFEHNGYVCNPGCAVRFYIYN